MYSSCPECGTVFRITTNELRAAEGFVRCGNCSATFNAVTTLTDEPPPTVTLQQLSLPTEPVPPAPPDVPDEPAEPEAPVPEEVASAEDSPPASSDTLEFDIPEDSWTNFFDAPPPAPPPPALPPEAADTATSEPEHLAEPAVEMEFEAAPEPAPAVEEADAAPEPTAAASSEVGSGIGSDTVDQAGLYRALAAEAGERDGDDEDWEALLGEVGDDDEDPEPVFVISEEDSPPPVTAIARPEEEPLPDEFPGTPAWDDAVLDDTRAPKPLPADFAADLPAAPADAEVSVADRPFVWEPPASLPPEPRRHWGYAASSVLLVLLLVMQLIHMQRDELATNPTLFEPLQRLYGALGLPLWPAWDLRSYQVRKTEAVTDRSSRGALDILARIDVVGNDRVGLPLVRVTLLDRFDNSLGSRVFQPDEYLGNVARPREPVAPGTQIPVEIRLKDPGAAATGFDVDICVMNKRDGLQCRAGREPFAR